MSATRVMKTSTKTSETYEHETSVTDKVPLSEQEATRCCAHAGEDDEADILRDDRERALREDDARARDEALRADGMFADAPAEGSDCGNGCEREDDGGEPRDMDAKELGRKGEDAAARYLERQGYEILERNWTCKFGEADIIARDSDGVLCFIEVKTRRSIEAGIPEEAVTPQKQRRYERIALSYLLDAEYNDGEPVRFDAIGICVTANRRALLRHHKGCFDGLF